MDKKEGLPGVVVCGGGTSAELGPEVAARCSAVLLPLGAPPREIRAVAGRNPTALVVADPGAVRCGALTTCLHGLAANGIRFGLLFTVSVEQGRENCRKVLRGQPLIRGNDGYVLVHTKEKDGAEPLWPVVRSKTPPDIATTPVDAIVFSGHSGPLDARAGTEAILCGRGDAAGYRGNGVYPCYFDGFCFRQPQLSRREDNPAAQLRPSQVNAKVAVIAGCRTVVLGTSIFSPAHGLAHLLLQGPPLAVIASCGVSFKLRELDLLCLSWITSGVPLGEVVHRLNTISRETLADCGGLPEGVGPFVLFGNPCLRFECEDPAEPAPQVVLPAGLDLAAAARHSAFTIFEHNYANLF